MPGIVDSLGFCAPALRDVPHSVPSMSTPVQRTPQGTVLTSWTSLVEHRGCVFLVASMIPMPSVDCPHPNPITVLHGFDLST